MNADLWAEMIFLACSAAVFGWFKRANERAKEMMQAELVFAWKRFEDERVDNVDARVEPCLFNGELMTRVRSRAELALALTLTISRRRIRPSRRQEFRLDDPDFSADFAITTTNELLARHVLSPPWRARLRELDAREFTYTNGNIDLTIPRGSFPDAPMLANAIALVGEACGWQNATAAYR